MDPKVHVIYQWREHKDFAASHMVHHPTVRRWETVMLNSYKLSVAKFPSRERRLSEWSERLLSQAKLLKAKYPTRVHIVHLRDLNKDGAKLLSKWGAHVPWDPDRGRNATGQSRDELRTRAKRARK